MDTENPKWPKYALLLAVFGVTLLGVYQLPPIAQPLSYHAFVDNLALWNIPNGLNVLSNLPFVLVGGAGLWVLYHNPRHLSTGPVLLHYRLFFCSVMLTGLGSAYYHWSPSNATLVWDRLGISLGLMALFSALLGELVSGRLGRRLLWPLLVIGVLTVIYWWYTELSGQGDLRPYLIMQFLPLILILLMLVLFRWNYTHQGYVYLLLLFYGLAKVCEILDREIYASLQVVSGHTLKHLWAALGSYWMLWLLQHRKPRQE